MEKEWIKHYKFVIISWILVIVYMIIFGLGYLDNIDMLCQVYIHSFVSVGMTLLMKIITRFGSFYFAALFCIVYILIDRQKGMQLSLFMILVMACNFILKNTIARLRPPIQQLITVDGFSFPSYHAMVAFALFGFIAYQIYRHHKRYAIILMIMVVCVGISRIYLGALYLSDVLGGYIYTFALLTTYISIIKTHKNFLKT